MDSKDLEQSEEFELPEFVGDKLKPGDPGYNPFADEDSEWYGIADFRPRGDRPIPTLRCHKIKSNGERCRRRAIRGSGLNGTKACCPSHGGQLPSVANYSKQVVELARLQLYSGTPDAIATIMELMSDGETPQAVRLKAATEILDRNNIKGTTDINIEVTQTEAPSAKLMKKLADMRKKDEPDEEPLEDLGETVVEEGETHE